jgi:hypothetical protein
VSFEKIGLDDDEIEAPDESRKRYARYMQNATVNRRKVIRPSRERKAAREAAEAIIFLTSTSSPRDRKLQGFHRVWNRFVQMFVQIIDKLNSDSLRLSPC